MGFAAELVWGFPSLGPVKICSRSYQKSAWHQFCWSRAECLAGRLQPGVKHVHMKGLEAGLQWHVIPAHVLEVPIDIGGET